MNEKELKFLQKIGAILLNMDERDLAKTLVAQELVEVFDDTGQKEKSNH